MTEKDIKNAIEYWKKTAEHDYQTYTEENLNKIKNIYINLCQRLK